MRILSLNCWGGRPNYLLQREFLARANADVYCLQEVYDAPPELPNSLECMEERHTLSVRPHLFEEIARVLPDHWGRFYPASHGYLHDGSTAVKERVGYGIATFVRKRIPLLSERMKFIFGEFRHAGWGKPPLPRNAHGLRLLCPRTGKTYVVVQTHGLWQPDGKEDTPERKTQAGYLRGLLMQMMETRDDYAIVCGDLNLLPESETFATLGDFVPRNLITEFNITDTRTSYYKKTPRYADYVLVSQQVEVERFEVPAQPEISDHRPMLLDIA